MDTFKDAVTLIKEDIKGIDEFGNPIIETSEREILCNRLDVYSQEFYQAANIGLKPQAKISIHAMEYDEEEKAIYKGIEYYILRTYLKGNLLEIVLGDKIVD
ncbi:phage head closure protein [Peptoniphilus senegalensis]|uniref:phage head closure protein n=1 Tax=Peptoniphilus senegalensis TaxID=1465757 RepID=UPI0002FED707|nr:phage head closure protein [Peptoniphilus senegalensis]